MNKLKVAALGLASTVLMLGAVVVPAGSAMADTTDKVKDGFIAVGGTGNEDLPGIAETIINTMLFIVGLLAVAMIIFAGIRYVTAHGDKSQIEGAKNTLIYSIVGLIVAIVAYALVNWVLKLF